MKTIVIIPTYNEKENIQKIIPAILRLNSGLHILVVDDNSPDGTAKVVRTLAQKNKETKKQKNNINLLLREKKEGLGRAYLAGFAWALKKNYDIIIQMDADFSHNPKYLSKMLKEIKNHDLVIGSRYIKGGATRNWSLSRKILSRSGSLYAKIILGLSMNDLTGGFKCWRTSLLKKIDFGSISSSGFSFQIEMNYRSFRQKASIKEIPIIFVDRQVGKSKMSKKIIIEALLGVWKMRFR